MAHVRNISLFFAADCGIVTVLMLRCLHRNDPDVGRVERALGVSGIPSVDLALARNAPDLLTLRSLSVVVYR